MKKKLFYTLNTFLVGLIVFLISFLVSQAVFAGNDHQNDDQCNRNNSKNCPEPTEICDKGEHVGNPHCITPTVTPTEEICTPTPTFQPSDCWNGQIPVACTTPTTGITPTIIPTNTPGPTATPTLGPTATPTPQSTSSDSSTQSLTMPVAAPHTGRAE